MPCGGHGKREILNIRSGSGAEFSIGIWYRFALNIYGKQLKVSAQVFIDQGEHLRYYRLEPSKCGPPRVGKTMTELHAASGRLRAAIGIRRYNNNNRFGI